MTTIRIKDNQVFVSTDLATGVELLKKNSNCESAIEGENVSLTYSAEELNTITSLFKSSKQRRN